MAKKKTTEARYASEAMQLEQQTKKQQNQADEKAQEIIRDFNRRAAQRTNFESQWQEIAERIVPLHSKSFNILSQNQTQGEKRTSEIFDSTASTALNRFGAILDSLLTPRNQTWHKIMADEPALNKSRDVRLYFEEVNRLLFKYRYSPRANYASQNYQNYKSLGAYGTGCMFVDEFVREPGTRYKNVHLSQILFGENFQGIIDDGMRYYPMTARQAHQKWGNGLPEPILAALKSNPEQEFFFIHCTKPRDLSEYDPERLDYKGMPYVSYYVSMTGNKLLSEGGFNSFPYAISRYEMGDNEIYGRSPAMEVLPAVKTLNEQKKTLLKQGHRALDPVLLTHDDGIIDGFSLAPGAMNAGGVSASGQPLVHALPVGRIDVGEKMMDDERRVINDAFLINIFQILAETPEMTATEVLERTREKGILLSPTVGRQQSEYLGPKIEREIDILSRQGVLPPMPAELLEARGQYNIVYDSPLSRAQRAEEAAGVSRTIEAAIAVSTQTQDPSVLDHFNFDVIVPQLADINGVPESWLNDPKTIKAIRAARQQQIEAQQTQNALPGTAAMVKSLAVAKKGQAS